jgi:AraC-like DNA-binding protein
MSFVLESRVSASPYVQEIWRARSERAGAFISMAASHWELVVTRPEGATPTLTVRGPETVATPLAYPEGNEWCGIRFRLGTFMPNVPPSQLVDRAFALPQATVTSFWLDRSAWELPGPDNADVFVDRLAGAGLLVHDPIASAVVQGGVEGLSTRAAERRVSRATGLTRGAIRQIRRAETAVELLSGGVPAWDAARQAGYADQPHLTRSLKRFVGQTPSQVAAPGNELSLSFKTPSPARARRTRPCDS